jgi:hypothetical protein
MATTDFLLSALAVLVLGLTGWKLALRLRFPAPALIGPMVLIAAAGMTGLPVMGLPLWLRIAIQSVVGGFIGRRIDRTSITSIRRLFPIVMITTSWYMAGTMGLGWLVARWVGIDLGTAILATVPGGVAEMTALAISSQVDVAFVATMQTLRVLAANTIVPMIARRGSGAPARQDPGMHPQPYMGAASAGSPGNPGQGRQELHWSAGLLAALAGGFLLTYVRMPAGGIMGSMLAVAMLQFAGFRVQPVPKPILTLAYIGLGISVGSSFNAHTLERLQSSAGILLLTTAATLASSFLLAKFVRRTMHLDERTALLACSPGGLSLMAVVAEETGAQTVIVSFLHLTRIVWIILAMPVILRLLS